MCAAASSPSTGRRPPTSPPALWLCLRFTALALEALREADGVPDFVYQHQRLLAVSRQAAGQGLYPGMSVNQALMVAPGARGRERDADSEQQWLQTLAHWAYRYTPQVSLWQQGLLLEVGGSLKLFQGFPALCQRVERDLADFAATAQMGVAHTPAAARVLSRAVNNGVQTARSNTSDEEAFLLLLGEAAIETLDVDDTLIARLQSCGFEVLEELLAAPRAEIGQRFGGAFVTYIERLLGETDDPQVPVVPPEPFLRVQTFAEPVHNSGWITPCTDALLAELCEYLRRRQWFCELLVWRFYSDRGLLERLSIPLSARHYGFDTLKQLTDLHLEKLSLGGELMRIELFSDRLLPAQLLADDLFDAGAKQREAAALVDKLATRLGPEAVYQLTRTPEPVPELAQRSVPFGVGEQRPQYTGAVTENARAAEQAFQPLWLLADPQPMTASADDPGRPLDNRGRPLQLIQGPERIDSHWWCRHPGTGAAGEPVDAARYRDYYIARQRNGRLLWLFFDRRRKQWFVQGVFG